VTCTTLQGGACADSTFDRPKEGDMNGPKLEVPAELRYLAEKTIEQAEKA
jgi:hypothetical protein